MGVGGAPAEVPAPEVTTVAATPTTPEPTPEAERKPDTTPEPKLLPEAAPAVEQTTATPTPEKEQAAPEPTERPVLNVGDTGRIGDLGITVNGVRGLVEGGLLEPDEGHYFLLVDVTFENRGDETEALSTVLNMRVQDSDGWQYSIDLGASVAGSNPTPDGEVLPGGILRGEIGYQVPIEATDLTWTYTGLFGSDRIVFALGAIDAAPGATEADAAVEPTTATENGGPCTAGMTLREGDHCTVDIPGINVGTDRFEIRGGSGCYGGLCAGTGANLNSFRASKNPDGSWTIDSVP